MIKFCHYVKINSFYNKYNICAFNKDIEGNPFIIRFKTKLACAVIQNNFDIEGNPFIIRFKTIRFKRDIEWIFLYIEGNPFIIRFKTIL